MSGEFRGAGTGPKTVLRGMMLLALGRREGIECFRATPDAFLAALAPGIALNLVSLVISLMQHGRGIALTRVALSFCALLGPPVVSHMMARFWKREEQWLRYATAAAWCEWVTVLVTVMALLMAALIMPSLAHQPAFGKALMVTTELYGVWLGWFVARIGLGIGAGKALLLYAMTVLFVVGCYALASVVPPHHAYIMDLFKPVMFGKS
ncbi:MAG: hypothetical protein SOH81_03975 [Acetobacter sp.]